MTWEVMLGVVRDEYEPGSGLRVLRGGSWSDMDRDAGAEILENVKGRGNEAEKLPGQLCRANLNGLDRIGC